MYDLFKKNLINIKILFYFQGYSVFGHCCMLVIFLLSLILIVALMYWMVSNNFYFLQFFLSNDMFIIIKFQFLHLKMKNKTSCSLSGLRWRHEGSQQHEDNQFSKTWTFKTLSLSNFQFCLDFSCTNWFTEIVTCTKNFIDICTKFLLLIFLKPVIYYQ